MRSGWPGLEAKTSLTTACYPLDPARLRLSTNVTDALVLASGGNALVDVKEDRESLVAGPALAHHCVDSFPQPPGAGGVAQVVTPKPGQLGLARIVGRQISAERPESRPALWPHVASEEVGIEGLAVAVKYQSVGSFAEQCPDAREAWPRGPGGPELGECR